MWSPDPFGAQGLEDWDRLLWSFWHCARLERKHGAFLCLLLPAGFLAGLSTINWVLWEIHSHLAFSFPETCFSFWRDPFLEMKARQLVGAALHFDPGWLAGVVDDRWPWAHRAELDWPYGWAPAKDHVFQVQWECGSIHGSQKEIDIEILRAIGLAYMCCGFVGETLVTILNGLNGFQVVRQYLFSYSPDWCFEYVTVRIIGQSHPCCR